MSTSYEPVIGLEVHAQLRTRTKLFCGCSIEYGAPPNTQVCPVCLGYPGALPVPNAKAIELAIRAALALGCEVKPFSRFARKNYFYPDLAKGYQISQFELPLNERGHLDIPLKTGVKRAGITRIHVEEDAAKNLHGSGAGTSTLVDFNRAGTALIEIVGEPDLRSSEEAEAYLKTLRDILMFAGVNDGNLEEGSFRCDANVSIRPVGQEKFGTRTELKNINSFRFVRKAIDYEIQRQEAVLAGGGTIVQETRTWSEPRGMTLSLRSKEDAHDYRYFSDPDLPPLDIPVERIEELRKTQPESIEAMRTRWQNELKLTEYDAKVLTGHPAIARYFDQAVAEAANAAKKKPGDVGKRVANFVQAEVLRVVTTSGLDAKFPVSAEALGALMGLIEDKTISGKIAKEVFTDMATTGKAARRIVDEKGLVNVVDTVAIEKTIREVLTKNDKEVEKYKAGKTNVRGFLVGQVMKASRGTADPATVNQLLDKLLAEA